ncbi:hypothetical protein EDB86DRAFT_3079786 [Lactarius hatsudake]|nr:hypothetical protein EDB86DRAFT_3079786 [Lactarius hatsudake]
MEQRGMQQQITHQTVHAYGSPSFDNLQSSLYSGFPELLGGGLKATQLPRPLPQYVQQHYIPDRDPPMAAQRSPPPSHRSSDRPHGHPSLHYSASPPQLRQPQPRQATAYTSFPQGQAYHSAHEFPTQVSRVPQQSAHMPLDPWAVATFTDHSNTHPTEMQGLPHTFESIYPSHQPPLSPLATAQAVLQKGPSTTTQNTDSPTSFQGKNEGNTTAENSPQLRSWGGAGSLDPATGVFSRAADHPRIRTAQACEKCRARKAKCSGEHPSCQRCLTRGLVCAYAPERRMRGPNKPKPPLTPLPDGSQPAAAAGQKTRKRASTMPSAHHRSPQIWGPQQRHKQEQEHGIAAPTSPASSVGSGSLGYPPPSESEASPMTPPHTSLDSRHLSVPVVGFSAPQRVLIQDFPTTAQRRAQARVNEGSNHHDSDTGAATTTRGVLAGVFGQDVFMM